MPYSDVDPRYPETPPTGAAPPLLATVSEAARQQAMARFQIIQPCVERGVPLAEVARHHGVALRTARRWVQHYRAGGLVALSRTRRASRGIPRRVPPDMAQRIEALALQTPPCPSRSFIGRSSPSPLPTARRRHATAPSTISSGASRPRLRTLAHHGPGDRDNAKERGHGLSTPVLLDPTQERDCWPPVAQCQPPRKPYMAWHRSRQCPT